MEALKRKIQEQSVVISEQVVNLDAVLNHQVEPELIMKIGDEFIQRFAEEKITKVLTIEASGISVGFATAFKLGVPLVFARRKKTLTTDQDVYSERVPSFTKGIVTDIVVSAKFLEPHDRVLIIDDIIANGDAVRGLVKIIERSGAALCGFGVVVEKSFQAGGKSLREMGIQVEALVKIKSLADGKVSFE